ncbi:MAG: isoprenylcysteine carboxylmethyltransferase family protein [Halobacteriaceae archaeon]
MDPVLAVAFGAGVAAAAVLWAALLATVALPGIRFWPPGLRDWRFALNWGLVLCFDAALAVVIFRTWDTWVLPRTAPVLGAGVALCLGGAALAVAGARALPGEVSVGLGGQLQTGGLYDRTRNPQYLGMVAALVGAVLLVDSLPATVLLLLNAGWLLLRPFAEERYLAERHGEAYERYRERVPRFVGRRTLRWSAGD